MSFRFKGVHPEQFAGLIELDDAALAEHGFCRMVADKKPGFPCRVTLEDAEPGERLLLINYEHQPAHSPYRATGPIFVREQALAPYDSGEVPPVLRPRTLSLRAYDANAMIVDAEVVEGANVETALTGLFARPDTDYVHVHYAARGCFAMRVERG